MKDIKYSLMVVASVMGMIAPHAYAQPASLPAPPTLPPAALPILPPAVPSASAIPPAANEPLPALPLPATPPIGVPAASDNAGALPVLSGSSQPAPTGSTPDAAVDANVVEPPKQFSYGASNLSVLFLPSQIERMKQSIRTYETTGGEPKPTNFVAPTPVAEAPVEKIIEPTNYPDFYLSSIAYDAPNDWALWIGGQKITSRNNDTDVTVVHVAPDSATFSWQPTYKDAIERRRAGKLFAATDIVKNKLASTQNASQDEKGVVTFSLRQNQTFAVGYFKTFEGFVKSPKLDPITVAAPEASMSTIITGTLGNLVQPRTANSSIQPQPMNLIDRLSNKGPSPTAMPNDAPPSRMPPSASPAGGSMAPPKF